MNTIGTNHSMFDERFVSFDCAGDTCLGVLTMPKSQVTHADLGVLVIVGGPQMRVGSHRQFVLLARALAAAGVPAFRFDYRGMGDSAGDARTFEHIRTDIVSAIEVLQREAGVDRVVLWGLCDGASAAWMDGADDPRVDGIVAVNPWARSPQGEATTRLKHYYLQRLLAPEFWRKVISGRSSLRQRAGELAGAVQTAARPVNAGNAIEYLKRMEDGWGRFTSPILVILSGNDYTAREFEGWVAGSGARKALLSRDQCEVVRMPDADHTFSSRVWRDRVSEITIEWIGEIGGRCR